MRNWMVYGALLIGSALVGFLVGGGPDAIRSSPVPAVLPPPASTTPSSTTEPTATTEAPTTVGSTAPPDDSTTSTSIATSTTIPPETTSSSPTTTTIPPTSTTAAPVELRPREDLSVAVANGVGTPGVAGIGGQALLEVGYDEPATRDAVATGTSQVYFAVGFEGEAARLALDVDLDASAIAPVAQIPELLGSGPAGFDLILVLGADGLGPR